ncbi:MAG: DegT/DnrJ/EryC1/StrS family aminotransferase [Planctomycetes bacterium]|nr:DegT/DnrJ/EryC1/StrS family aminotransferase [Planctomycetota bacterium]
MSKPALLGGKPVFSKTHRWPRWPQSGSGDRKRVLDVLDGDEWGMGSRATAEFARRFAGYLGAKYVLPVNTGTAALELIVKALGIGPGDEVIVPSYTFVASATCVLEVGAGVIFADIDPRTFNIDPEDVARRITPRTRAIIAVHFGGNPADLIGLRGVIGKRNIALIEDAAHAHGMLYHGHGAGRFSAAAAFSFQSSKNMTCGEGGAIATRDKKLFELAGSFHSFGRKPGKAWYQHYYLAWNDRISAMQSALLLGQLDRIEPQTRTRFSNGAFLNRELAKIRGLSPQADGDSHPDTRRAYHVYMLRYDGRETGLDRAAFLEALQAEGVGCSPGYPAPLQEAHLFTGRRFWHAHRLGGGPRLSHEPDYRKMKTPVAKTYCDEAVWLPHPYLLASRKEMQGVVDAVARVVENAGTLRKRRS